MKQSKIYDVKSLKSSSSQKPSFNIDLEHLIVALVSDALHYPMENDKVFWTVTEQMQHLGVCRGQGHSEKPKRKIFCRAVLEYRHQLVPGVHVQVENTWKPLAINFIKLKKFFQFRF